MAIKGITASLFILMLLGCEDKKLVAITDNPVYGELFVKYERATDRTTGTAAFWDGSHTKRLIFHSAAKLLFVNTPMDYQSSDNTYIKDVRFFQSPATFTITDVNNKTFTNSISMNGIDFPAVYRDAVLDTIDSSKPFPLTWVGSDGTGGVPVEDGETVSLRIGNISAQQDTIGSRSVTFTVANFAALDPSLKGTTVPFAIERIKTITPLPDPLGGGLGTISGQYIAVPRTVYLK